MNGGRKVCIFDRGHLTKMAAMSIYSTKLKNILLQKYKADCLETCYDAYADLDLQKLYIPNYSISVVSTISVVRRHLCQQLIT